MEEIILDRAKNVFFNYGLKGISMDELARETGISKRKIYTFFADKNELIEKLVDGIIEKERMKLKECSEKSKDAIDEILMQSDSAIEFLSKVNPGFFTELQKTIGPMWDKIHYYKNQVLMPAFLKNLHRGIAEKLYREDLEPEFAARVRIQQIDTIWQPNEYLTHLSTPEILMKQLTHFFLHGITSEKGKEQLKFYLTNNNG